MQTNQVSPAEQIKKDIDAAKSDLTSLISKVSLTSVRDEYSDLDSVIANLPIRIQKIRDRKYAYNKINEKQADEFQKQWSTKKMMIQNQITIESNNLRANLRPLETRVANLNLGAVSGMTVKTVQNELDSYESRVSAAESSMRELFDGVKKEVEKVTAQLSLVEATLDHSETASFGFLPGESVVMAVKAVWTRDNREDKDDPEGILFITDQRLIFEQKQEIATKKVLFVTTERQLVQKLMFETPVVSIDNVKATKQGLFKNEDWLELQFASGAFARDAKLHLDGQASVEWQKLITRVKTKEIDSDRAFELDKTAVEKARTAPDKCPNCGGAITKPVLRGMDTITCDFCGNVIRL
jgi:hypothetical protein